MTVRRVITRSKKTFRVKFPSKKNKCMVQCESILESKTALLLEISPHVKKYVAQPSVEIYYDEKAQPRKYIPDFRATLLDDSTIDIEVKPKSKLYRPDIKGKYEAIARRYEEQGRRFRILTEDNVAHEPLHSNLKKLNYHRKLRMQSESCKKYMHMLATQEFCTISDAAKLLGGESHVYDMIAMGVLSVDISTPLKLTSEIRIADLTKGVDENDPFRL